MPLSDQQLLDTFRDNRRLAVPFFGGKEVELFFEDEEELLELAENVRSFMGLGEAQRLEATRHLWAYFNDFTSDVGLEWVDAGLKALSADSPDIWNFVQPSTLSAERSWDLHSRDVLRPYVIVECNCDWEAEHGLLLSWRDGTELVKVSGYDGHATNGHAYNDLSRDAWVYNAVNPQFRTTA